MRFESGFDVAGRPEKVLELFSDVPLVVGFLPGAGVGERNEDGSFPATLEVAFGPKRIKFQGSLVNSVDHHALTGAVTAKGKANLAGARIAVAMKYRLSRLDGTDDQTKVDIESEANLTGLLAAFADSSGVLVTRAILNEFAARFSAYVQADSSKRTALPPAPPSALSGVALCWIVVRGWVKAIVARVRAAVGKSG